MPDIKVKGYSGNDLVYQNVDKVYFRKSDDSGTVPFSYGDAVDNIPIQLNFANGNQIIAAPEGTLVRSAVIEKPEDLTGENIRAGREIGGIPGEFIGDTEEVTVDLNMVEGDQIILPSAEGKVLSKVTILKPDDLKKQYVAKGKEIGGIKGELEGAEKPFIEYTLNEDGEVIAAKMYGFTEIPEGCFAYSSKLESVDMSESPGITNICSYAFRGCAALKSITLPDEMSSINPYTFYGCSSLTSIIIPNGVTSIGTYAFYGCSSLASINIPEGVTKIDTYAFYNSGLTSVVIPNSVTEIGDQAFRGCLKLETVALGTGITSIGNYAFMSAPITRIELGAQLSFIGYQAFVSTSLTSATFKDTTTWYVSGYMGATSGTTLSSSSLANTSTAATYLKTTYVSQYWYKT